MRSSDNRVVDRFQVSSCIEAGCLPRHSEPDRAWTFLLVPMMTVGWAMMELTHGLSRRCLDKSKVMAVQLVQCGFQGSFLDRGREFARCVCSFTILLRMLRACR